MRLVFWKNKKVDSDNVLASCNNSKRCSVLRYYCPNVSQLVCNQRKCATRCSQVVGWLVWMGLMSAFQIWCEFLEKRILSLFVGIFAGVNECSFSKFMSFVAGFGNSLAQGNEELWHSQNLCLSGWGFWCFSGPKCRRIMAFQKFVSFWVGFWCFSGPK